jgi:hypothetical protein
MSRSDQLGLRCSVEPNCSGLSTRLADASVTCDRVLDTARWGSWGTCLHQSSPLGEARVGPRDSAGAYLDREVRSRAEEHVAASESTSAGRRGLELRNTWQRRNSTQQGGEVRSHGTYGGSEGRLFSNVWSKATAYMATCRYIFCYFFDLELICRGNRSSGS